METRCRKREAMFPRIVICSQCGIKVGREKLFDHMEKTCRQRPEVVEARAAKKEAERRQEEDKLVAKFGKCPKCDDHKTDSGYCWKHTCNNYDSSNRERCSNYKLASKKQCDSCTASDKRAEWGRNLWFNRALNYFIDHPEVALVGFILLVLGVPIAGIFVHEDKGSSNSSDYDYDYDYIPSTSSSSSSGSSTTFWTLSSNGYTWNRASYSDKMDICQRMASVSSKGNPSKFYYDAFENFYDSTDPSILSTSMEDVGRLVEAASSAY